MGAENGHWSTDHSPAAKPCGSKDCGLCEKQMFGLHKIILCKPCQNEKKLGYFRPVYIIILLFSLFFGLNLA